MSEVNNKYSNLFKRVTTILSRINKVNQGDAKTFRDNINQSIGTLPELEAGHIKKNEQGDYLDGTGMAGAVYAMGDILGIGLSEIDNTITTCESATASANNAAKSASKSAASANNAAISANNAATSANNAVKTVSTIVGQSEKVAQLKIDAEKALADAKNGIDAVSGKVNNFLIVSTANGNGKPIDTKGEQVNQILGGIWFKIKSD